MGLSASQARLLSITTRLSHNELESQMISNSKVRLANETQRASDEYIDALNSTKLMYTTYDDEGTSTQVALTPAVMYTYSSAKNQYAIMNNNNQVMVSATDAKNYEETDSLTDFLDRYGLVEDIIPASNQQDYEAAMAQYEKDLTQYNEDLAQYNIDKKQYDEVDYPKYLEDYAQYEEDYVQYLIDLENYKESDTSLYDTFVDLIGTSQNHNTTTGYCYDSALNGASGCYEHLIAHLLDWQGGDNYSTDTYTTTSGKSVKLQKTEGGMTRYALDHQDEFLEMVAALQDESRKCDGDDAFVPDYNNGGVEDTDKYNLLQDKIDNNETITEKDILISDYIYDANTNTVTGIKSLRQKMIDVLYVVQNYTSLGFTSEEMKDSLINFTEGDMKALGQKPVEPTKPTEPTAPTAPIEPTEPTEPTPIPVINDQAKGQWYVNLWYLMNGSETANLLQKYNDVDETTEEASETGNLYTVATVDKNAKTAKNYEVLEDNLFTSKEWLQFAVEHGCATLCKAQYNNPSEDSEKATEITSAAITWSGIIHTSAVDISTVEDDAAIAKAEAVYKKRLNEIESKDTKYDNDIKKLDTEHNALQTEYESLQNIISKNTERSFKAFS